VIKAILMLEAGVILPNSNFVTMNPKIDAESLHIAVAKDAIPWPSQGLRRISVQCFGFGGANTHVVLDDTHGYLRTIGLQVDRNMNSPGYQASGLKSLWSSLVKTSTPSVETPNKDRLFVWSTDDENGIERTKDAWKNYIRSLKLSNLSTDKADQYLDRLAYTLSSRRSHLSWRAFSVVAGIENVADLADRMSGPIRASLEPKLTFVFTGQGSQWFAMGRELIGRYEMFNRSLEDSSKFFRTLGCKWDVIGLSPRC
jgi:acyl transferase domain-containing protein